MNVYLTEAVGTMFLVLIIALAGDPLAIGIGLAILIYMGASISGAHYNPAVTITLFLRNKISKVKAFGYIIAQLFGGIIASLIVNIIFNKFFTVTPSASASWTTAMIGEALFTFLLCTVVLQVAASKKTQGNQYFGFAIGGTVFCAASAMGKISGGAFNPAVGIGPLVANLLTGNRGFDPALLFLYIIGPVVGGILASFFHEVIQK